MLRNFLTSNICHSSNRNTLKKLISRNSQFFGKVFFYLDDTFHYLCMTATIKYYNYLRFDNDSNVGLSFDNHKPVGRQYEFLLFKNRLHEKRLQPIKFHISTPSSVNNHIYG